MYTSNVQVLRTVLMQNKKTLENQRVRDYYTIRDVSKALSVSSETVRRYIREGKLNARKISTVGLKKIWVVDHNDLEEFNKKSD